MAGAHDTSPSYTDVKIYNGNEILFHWIFRGFRADTDLSVQQQFADEFFIKGVCRGRVRLSVVVAAFSGWRVSVFSFECGGRTYSVGPNGTVIAGDSARLRFGTARLRMPWGMMPIGWSSATVTPTTASI